MSLRSRLKDVCREGRMSETDGHTKKGFRRKFRKYFKTKRL